MELQVPDGITCLAWSHGGALLAVGTAGACVCMHDSVGARVTQTPCRSAVTAMAWSPPRCALACGCLNCLCTAQSSSLSCPLQATLPRDAGIG